MDIITSSAWKDRITSLISEFHTPGLALAVVNDNAVKHASFGYACLEPAVPTTPTTIFDVASMSKSFTAASILKLIEDKERYNISLDTPVTKILPGDFILQDAWATEHITVEDILSHRSGMPGHDEAFLGIDTEHPDMVESTTRNLRNLFMTAAPRTTFQYNNTMYTVATHIVEKLTGGSFAQFLQEHFFGPLEMTSTHLQPSAVLASDNSQHLSTPYDWSDKDEKYVELPHQEVPELQGAGSIQSTVVDYARWLQAMINHSGPVVTEQIYKQLTTGRMLVDADNEDRNPFTSVYVYALGWETYFYRGYQVILHGGGIPGYGSFMCFLPAFRFGVVILTNAIDGGDLGTALAKELIDEVLKVEIGQRPDWVGRMRKQYREMREATERKRDELRQGILEKHKAPDGDSSEQTMALASYIGTYHNAGYRDITISVRDGQLYIDALHRSNPFTILFEHVHANQYFIARHGDYGPNVIAYEKVEFRIGNGVEAVGIGIVAEDEDRLVWFEKVEE